MEHVKNGIAALYSIIEKYKLNTPSPYVLSNIINYANTFIFADWAFILHLIIVIILDTILGVWVSLRRKNFSSWEFGKVFNKIAIYFLVLIATHNAGAYFIKNNVKFIIDILDTTVYAAIMIREYMSLLEKLPALKIWMPSRWIVERLQIWYDTGQFKEEGKDKKKEAE